jgi:hypothetical protein
MDESFLKKERRRQAQLERLGTNTPSCTACGEADPSCLELHHIAGRKFGDNLVVVCRNCHRKLTDAQSDHPIQESASASPNERIGRFMFGLADFFAELAIQLREFARQLTE